MAQNNSGDMSELHYNIPADILRFETKYIMGLTFIELALIALPAIGAMMIIGVLAGILTAVFAFAIVRRVEAYGGRSAPIYFWQWLLHSRRKNHQVAMPLLMPAGQASIEIYNWGQRDRPSAVVSGWGRRQVNGTGNGSRSYAPQSTDEQGNEDHADS